MAHLKESTNPEDTPITPILRGLGCLEAQCARAMRQPRFFKNHLHARRKLATLSANKAKKLRKLRAPKVGGQNLLPRNPVGVDVDQDFDGSLLLATYQNPIRLV